MNRKQLIDLLFFPEDSPEAEAMRQEACHLSRRRFHDTCLLPGLLSGANSVCAECGVNPRDWETNRENGRGGNVAKTVSMLTEARVNP